MAGERAGQLVATERLEEARRGEVLGLAVGLGERAVRDLADERLDERVLAALRAARVRRGWDEQLAPDERPQARLELGLGDARDRGEGGRREALAEDGRIVDEGPVGRRRGRRGGRR